MISTILRLSMITTLAAATPATAGTFEPWAQWGLAGLVVAFVLWDNAQRERRMNRIMQENSTWVKETLLGALAKNTQVMEQVYRSLTGCERRQVGLATQQEGHADPGGGA